ncbi:hypothetical protein Indivirus_12_1 [Indivirus ILV1]|uniref:C2H2-type domain-containing protein n=1 Tax=Indivirus ILV1 TaxID=1977633 RepID=A0A1V0SED1_9VIRU|nr:hypothetical protein Indivirus_12_1 [Indivirus ILV1]
MLYECSSCNYSTNDKSNYTRHLKSASHIKKNSNAKSVNNSKKELNHTIEYKCECGISFNHYPRLSRHKKKCVVTCYL